MICSTICARRYIFCLFKKCRVKFFFKLFTIHYNLRQNSLSRFFLPHLKMNLKIYHTSKHNTTITLYPFPHSDSFIRGGIAQSKGIEAKTIQKCCTLNDNALATVSQSVGRSLVQTIFRSMLSSGKFTRYSILKHIL